VPALLTARADHACCSVRGTVVVLGGGTSEDNGITSSVEMLSEERGAFVNLPSLSCGNIWRASVIALDESDSAAGQVLLLGGQRQGSASAVVHLVDLATGTCTRQPDMLHARRSFAAARLKDGRVVCAGGVGHQASQISPEV
jgi:tRNA A37 threonylcarbamoyltransferase TsaD